MGFCVKRLVDVVVGSLLAVLSAPIVLITAVVVALSLRTWPVFMHERVGRGGRPFKFIKLRTLPRYAPKYASKYQVTRLPVPRACRWLRAMHLDELPQLWLVVTGRMSLVGPRPEMAFLLQQMDQDFVRRRTNVRPGCTGLWQISSASQGLIGEHPEYDDFYLRHQSLGLDAWILARTALVLVRGPRGKVVLSAGDLAKWQDEEAPIRSSDRQLHPVET
jgi:lipopolysaccharide/colanic/teichoic acid biosynthesis glycosyltransferase